jgi:hypothetical protein
MLLKQSTTRDVMFYMVQSADDKSGLTGATVTVNISKNGGAFAAAAGAVSEVANGWYKVALTTADSNTLGDLAFRCTATSANDTDFVRQVVAFDPGVAYLTGATVVETQGSYTVQQAISVMLAALAGVTSSGGATFATPDGVSTRIAATTNASNERTAMTLTPSS